MKRTSLALKRLGVPVLASTLLMTGAQFALGTSAFAAGALTITPNPASGAVGTPVTLTITDTGDTAGETVNLSVTGNATFGSVTTGNGTNTATKTCPANGGATADVCTVTVNDATAETVVVTATGATSGNVGNDNVTFSSTTNGTLAITPNPAYGTATPVGGSGQTPDQTVTYSPGSQSVNTGAQTITLTVSGSAKIIAPNGAQVAGSSLTGTGTQTATCTTGATSPQGCKFAVTDTVSEAVTVTAHDSTDTTAPNATATDNFNGLSWANCPTTARNTFGNCVTQQAPNTSKTYTVTYTEAGAPVAGRSINFSLIVGNPDVFPTTQPAGTVFTSSTTASCTTDAQGHCSVTVNSNAAAAGSTDGLVAQSTNTAPYPDTEADLLINFVASVTPGRLVQTSATAIRPATQPDAVNEPGDAVQLTYQLQGQCTPASGQNNCSGAPLANTPVTLTVDHGFFTPNCISADASHSNNYANCTFDPAAAAGGKVGSLKSSGTTMQATTDASGNVTVTIGIGRDSAFDQNGTVVATVSAAGSSGSPFAESQPGNSTQGVGSNPACTSPSVGTPEAGCPTGTKWTTVARPLNGASVKIVSVPNTTSEPALSDTATNNVPTNNGNTRVFVVHLTDQFGNLTSGGTNANAGVTLASTGVADLVHCTSYSNSATCSAPNTASGDGTPSGISTDSSGVNTRTYTHVLGSYLSAFNSTGNPVQERYEAVDAANTTGTQTIKASWAAPVTTFNTFTAATSTTPAVATYTTTTSTMTDSVAINWYNQNAQPVATFATTPSNKVPAGTVVTVSATVKDQFGQPIQGDNVQFIRSGPQTNNGTSCSATQSPAGTQTNASGQAGFSFTCTNPSTQVVTIVVQDGSGNELARGTQTIQFTGSTPPPSGRISLASVLKCIGFKNHPGVIRCRVHEAPRMAGLWYTLYHHVHGKNIRIASKRTNSNGVIYFTIRHLKPHSWFAAQAFHRGTRTTKPSHTAVNGTHVG